MKTSTVLSLATVAIFAVVNAKVITKCTDSSDAWVLVQNGLSNYKALSKAGKGKIAFIVDSGSLDKAERVAKKLGSHAIVWELSEKDLKSAHKIRKDSKKLKLNVKKKLKSYKKKTGKNARFVIVPKKTSKRIVKAFESRKVTVVRASRKATSYKKTKKLIKKARKNKKKTKTLPGDIILFKFERDNNARSLKKLRKALHLIKGKECFSTVELDTDADIAENATQKSASNSKIAEVADVTEPRNDVIKSINFANGNKIIEESVSFSESDSEPDREPDSESSSTSVSESVNESDSESETKNATINGQTPYATSNENAQNEADNSNVEVTATSSNSENNEDAVSEIDANRETSESITQNNQPGIPENDSVENSQ